MNVLVFVSPILQTPLAIVAMSGFQTPLAKRGQAPQSPMSGALLAPSAPHSQLLEGLFIGLKLIKVA